MLAGVERTKRMSEQPISIELSLKNYKHDRDVDEYIALHPFVRPTLIEAYEQVIKFFGDEVEVVLKLVYDPEIPNFEHLVGYIWTETSVEEAQETLDKFDRSWYLSLSYELRSKLYFTIRTRR
jgi:hypothetical protein